ncbi:MAG: hypothetical protein IBX54_08105 [Rhodoferax sp.]|nr:hypothetical protein [Rhodoferax sp.]
MTASRLSLAMFIALTGTAVLAADQATTDHTAHHPATAASAGQNTNGLGTSGSGRQAMDQMETHMKAMQELHQKMMAAKTPEERSALMPAHAKAMTDAMGMMQGMSGMTGMGMMGGMKSKPMADKLPADMGACHQMMEKRMEMMQSMMQMMMDRLPAATEK